MGGYSGGGTAGYPYPTKKSLRAEQPEAVDHEFVIAVLDTGVTLDGPSGKAHPFIAPNLTSDSADYPDKVEKYRRPRGHEGSYADVETAGPLDGHGTFVAGVILREAPFAKLAMRNPLDTPYAGPPAAESVLAKAIRDLASVKNLKLVNLGGYNVGPVPGPPAEIEAALDLLFEEHPHVLVVTSLSNNWRDEKVWPASFNAYDKYKGKLIAVGAVDESPTPYQDGRNWRTPPRASFANWGGVDVWASGVSVLGPHLQPNPGSGRPVLLATGEEATGWVRWSGTPFATAAVTGRVARLMKHSGRTGPTAFKDMIAPRPDVEVPGVPERKPWVQAKGSHWAPFPGE